MDLPLKGVVLATVLLYLGIVVLLEQAGLDEKVYQLHFEVGINLVLPEKHSASGEHAHVVKHC